MVSNVAAYHSCVMFCVLSFGLLFVPLVSAHNRFVPKAFDGALRLSHAPRVGKDGTLTLSIRSNLPETAQAQIWFRLPKGTKPRSPDVFEQVYFPPYAQEQHYSVLLHVEKPGNYPLQVSIYATLPNSKVVIAHFYTYLLVMPSHSEVGSEPFDQQMDGLFLETRARFRSFRANAGEVTIGGSVVYFDDNERIELPIHRPQVILFLENPIGDDIEIASTFADKRGEYVFGNLTASELNDGRPRNLYVTVRFENDVLSLTDRRNKLYESRSEIVRNAPDGETVIDLLLDQSDPNRAIGHIFNRIQRVHQFLLDQVGWERARPVQVIWPGTGSISFYFPSQFGEQLVSETITIAQGPDQWRAITMYHEYGHAVMTAAYGYNYNVVPKGNYQGFHRLETVSDPGFAFNEGWAEFVEASADNRALNVTAQLNQELPNIESNAWWTGHAEGRGSNVNGEKVEGAVASILWDIFDTEASIDLQPGVDDDGVANRFDLLWEILTNDSPQNIMEVAEAWRDRGFPMLEELEEIYAGHHTLARPNIPPIFRFTAPAVDGALADSAFQVAWEVSDPDGDDFTIDLFYDVNRLSNRSTPIQSDITSDSPHFNWNTKFVAEGKYYLRAVVTDVRHAETDVYSDGLVFVDHTPLLPPIITSGTHPGANRWYVNNSPQLDLRTQPKQINGRQYSFILNHQPETVPDTIADALVRNNKLTLAGLGDGAWWVHVRARDDLGYWTGASHFAINIDGTAPPVVANLRWRTEVAGDSSGLILEWDAVSDTSGIVAYHVQIDTDSSDFRAGLLFDNTVDGNLTRYTLSTDANLTYYAQVKAENGANVLSRNWSVAAAGGSISESQASDVNGDGTVDLFDLVLVASHFGETIAEPTHPHPDVNGDGIVDIDDLIRVADHFGESLNAAPGEREFVNALIMRYAMRRVQYQPDSVKETRLLPNYPNPFNPETWIPYELAAPTNVHLEIYAADGQLVRHLHPGRKQAGRYHLRSRAAYWDGRDYAGALTASGVYFYVLHAGDRTYTRKMAISK